MEDLTARNMRKLSNENYYISMEELRSHCYALIRSAATSGKCFERPFDIFEIYDDEGMHEVKPHLFKKMIEELKEKGFTVIVPKSLFSRKPNYFRTIVRW